MDRLKIPLTDPLGAAPWLLREIIEAISWKEDCDPNTLPEHSLYIHGKEKQGALTSASLKIDCGLKCKM